MPLKICRFLQVLGGIGFLLCGLGIVNTMVSLKYEIKDNDCISVVDGRDLCQTLHFNWLGLAGAGIFIVTLPLVKIKGAKSKG